jgi:hypothetical protein
LLKIKEYKGINIIKPEEFLGYFWAISCGNFYR